MGRVHGANEGDAVFYRERGESTVPSRRRWSNHFGGTLAQEVIDDPTSGGTVADEQDVAASRVYKGVHQGADTCLDIGVSLGLCRPPYGRQLRWWLHTIMQSAQLIRVHADKALHLRRHLDDLSEQGGRGDGCIDDIGHAAGRLEGAAIGGGVYPTAESQVVEALSQQVCLTLTEAAQWRIAGWIVGA